MLLDGADVDRRTSCSSSNLVNQCHDSQISILKKAIASPLASKLILALQDSLSVSEMRYTIVEM